MAFVTDAVAMKQSLFIHLSVQMVGLACAEHLHPEASADTTMPLSSMERLLRDAVGMNRAPEGRVTSEGRRLAEEGVTAKNRPAERAQNPQQIQRSAGSR